MTQASPLCVVAAGLVTPIGYRADTTLAALHAGVSGVRSLGNHHPPSGERLRGGRVALSQRWTGTWLHADLLAPAIGECLGAVTVSPKDVPWLVGTSATTRPGRPRRLDEALLPEVANRLGLPLHPASATLPADAMGAAYALERAAALIAEGRAKQVIVAGVDSFLHEATLNSLIKQRRLLVPGHLDGFLPGEGAAAVLVRAADVLSSGPEAGMVVRGLTFAQEEAPIGSGRPFRGEGLTAAVAGVLNQTGLAMDDIAWRITDVSGEHFSFKEAMLAALRLDRAKRDSPLDLWHPIEFTGHLGAALTPLVLAWARHAFELGYAPGPCALCHVGNDTGGRAAFIVEAARSRHKPWLPDQLALSLLDSGELRKEFIA
ncbi:beta-ketoacyl synthase N-terminal-like domain-containing protein [Roseateles sp. MS654]|uniref:beta-ketoacyl synthase N-terminal-like domain-containing protein n=1 Tax=Roseateles sp. MS654 TaxID=3412685 RepID=UPI003C2BA366